MKRIVFFTTGAIPTVQEKADLAELNALAAAPYQVYVANKTVKAVYGEPDRLIPCDFVYGDVPALYSAKPVFNPDGVPPALAVGTEIPTTDGGYVKVVVDGITLGLEYHAPVGG